jgi:hypothetical protein
VSVLATLKKLVLGETWILPVGLVVAVALSLLCRALLDDAWQEVGGFVLLGGVACVLLLAVAAGARPR